MKIVQKNFTQPTKVRAMETIKCTIQLVFLPVFCVMSMRTYFNMLPLTRLETRQKSGVGLAHFKISMTLKRGIYEKRTCQF
ncbi:hypothetical protein HRM2_43270 [Desulforapulum autotrophicum HRM2]|uniref:Uncharacterized protein n=1 Tax=Desulforapulum autotrophicum (strain ATCC 43914 / DSM 3382 / VKM B-1955 / HRM2) TaxID=177437 RepID=C0QDW2_DESAH|nr:hypothetical protein HRM2_43270 [Desulforapulum autotrophicum HRM2]